MNKKFVSAFSALLLVLLLTSTVFAAPAAAKVGVPFKGSLQALEIGGPDVTASGSGNATHLGRFTYSYTVTISPTGSMGEAVGILFYHFVAANGDSLFSTGEGTGGPTEVPNTFRIVETHTITGGTGRFAGATGNFTVKRLILQPEGITWGTFDGSIVLAKNN
jgi:hypothetical protein